MDAYNKLEYLRRYIEKEGFSLSEFIETVMSEELGEEMDSGLIKNPYSGTKTDKKVERDVFSTHTENGVEYSLNMHYGELSNGNRRVGAYLGPRDLEDGKNPDYTTEQKNGFSIDFIYADSKIEPSAEARILTNGNWSDGSKEDAYKCLDIVRSIIKNGENSQ